MRRSASSTSATIACASACRAPAPTRVAEPLLGARRSDLTGRIASGPHGVRTSVRRAPSADVRERARRARAGVAPSACPSRVGHERRQRRRPARRRRSRRSARRSARRCRPRCSAMAGPRHERVRRALERPRRPRSARRRRPARGASRSASRIPGTARIGPIEITGFDGPITIASAPRRSRQHLGVGGARPRCPRSSTSSTGPARALADHELLERRASRRVRATHVRDRLVGTSAAPAPRTPSAAPQLGERLGQARALGEPPARAQARSRGRGRRG